MKKITGKVLTVFVLFCMIVLVIPGITAAQSTTPAGGNTAHRPWRRHGHDPGLTGGI